MGSILVKNVGKAYKQYPSRFGRLLEWLSPKTLERHTVKWVLQDISFKVQRGEALGIIGINGAGKSTLLKMIAGTTQPTTGSITLNGRVAALLELGMGFHPDFTGRQNVHMAGQLLGLSSADIERLMPQIESFAEIGDAIDKPVRIYSSGMQMRLAFSVATVVRPDVLIVDEALSVGDAYFQHKSFERIREYRSQGTTLLIVSHDRGAIQAICDRAILLNAGRIEKEGSPESIMDYYNALIAEKNESSVRQVELESGRTKTLSGTGEATIAKISLLNASNNQVEIVDVGSQVSLVVEVAVVSPIPELVVGYMIKDRLGQAVFGTNSYFLEQPLRMLNPGDKPVFSFSFPANFGEGSYSVSIALHGGRSHVGANYEWQDLATVFEVVNASRKQFVGCAWIEPNLRIEL
jgi:lipopolysaccharide transport system ATP-binding protein